MTQEQEKQLKKLFRSWSKEQRENFASAMIQAALIGKNAKGYPVVAAFIKNGLMKAGTKYLYPTEAGYILLNMTKAGKDFLSIGK